MPDSFRISLPDPVQPYLRPDIQSKLAYLDVRISAATLSADGNCIDAIPADILTGAEQEEIGAAARRLVRTMCEDAFEPELTILEERPGPAGRHPDPMDELLRRREVVREGDGIYAIGPMLTAIIDYVEARLMTIATDMGALPHRFPALISPEFLEKVQYFKNFPHSLSFVSHLNESLPDIERFAAEGHCCDGHIVADPGIFAAPKAMLSPTVCHHLYLMLADSKIAPEGIIATAVGNCFRFESRNMGSLERVWNFTMREIIFVGDDEFADRGVADSRAAFRHILDDLELGYAVMTANDPFFVGTFRDQAAYQAAFELKHEVRANLPYADKTIAVASYNRHGNFFGRTLNIVDSRGDAACTACFAVGLERLAHAFVAQHGLEPAQWPPVVRDAVQAKLAQSRGFAFQG